MNQQQIQQIADQLKNYASVAIFCGGEPTIDTLGSALALSMGLTQIGKSAQVLMKNQPMAQHSRLVGVDKVQHELASQKSFVISLPNAVDAIERVSCYAEGQNLNIVLQPYPDVADFNFDKAKYSKLGGSTDALILVDVANMQEVGSLLGSQSNLLNQLPTIAVGKVTDARIQNRIENQTATAPIVLKLLQALGADISGDIAGNLMQGIYESTHDFHAPQLVPQIFEDAAFLLRIVHKSAGKVVLPVPPEPEKPQPPMPSQPFGRPPMPGGMMPPLPNQAGMMPSPPLRPPMPQQPFGQQPLGSLPPLPPIPRPQPQGGFAAGGFSGEAAPVMPKPPAPRMAREWEIDDDFEFDIPPDQSGGETPMGPGALPPLPQQAAGPIRNQMAPMQGGQPRMNQPHNQPKQNQGQNQPRQAQKQGGQQPKQDGGQKQPKPNQGQSQQNQPRGNQPIAPQPPQPTTPQSDTTAPEEDWLSPKIYKTEDLL